MNLKPYPEYKDSGVPWLGDVPKHWEVHLLKRVSRFAYGDSLSNEKRINGDVPVFGSNGKVGNHNSANTKSPVIIIGRKGSYGKLNYSKLRSFVIDIAYFIDESQTQTPLRWLFYALSSLDLDTQSKDAAVPGLSRDDAYRKIIFVPTLAEQTTIASFLDYKTAQIARFIKVKKRMIELLKEQKQVIINDAVTGKIDITTGKPYPKYKDSGVEWLGKVPEGWEVLPLRRCSKMVKTGGTPSGATDGHFAEEGFNWYTPCDFAEDIYLSRSSRQLSPLGKENVNIFPPNTIMMIGIGATIGKVSISKDFSSCNQQINAILPNEIINIEYLTFYLRLLRTYILSCGKFTTLPIINQDETKNLPILAPRLEEQLAITSYIKYKTASLDQAISRTEREIALMQEYRTRLISDVVTGKVDVRDIKIPDIADIDDTLDESIDEPEGEEEWETAEAEE